MRVSFSLRERDEVVRVGMVRRGREEVVSVTSSLREEVGNWAWGGTWPTVG